MIFSLRSILILRIKRCFLGQAVLKQAFLGEKYLKGAPLSAISRQWVNQRVASVGLAAVISLCGIFRSR